MPFLSSERISAMENFFLIFHKTAYKNWSLGTCIVFYKSHWSHSHSNMVPSQIIFEKGWMRASIDSTWIALEARQEVVLTDPLMPEAAFLQLACLALQAALISLGYEVLVLGLVWCASRVLCIELDFLSIHWFEPLRKRLTIDILFRVSPCLYFERAIRSFCFVKLLD